MSKGVGRKYYVYKSIVGSFLGGASTVMTHLMTEVLECEEKVNHAATEKQVLVNALNSVSALCNSVYSIDEAIQTAIKSLEGFSRTFGRLGQDFKDIADRMGEMKDTVEGGDIFIRAMAKMNLDEACSRWAEIKRLASLFVTFTPRQVTVASQIQ